MSTRRQRRDRDTAKAACVVCGFVSVLRLLEQHHVTPREAGGGDHPSNLVWLCESDHGLITRATEKLVQGDGGGAQSLIVSRYPTSPRTRKVVEDYARHGADEILANRDRHKPTHRVVLELDTELVNVYRAYARARRQAGEPRVGYTTIMRRVLADSVSRNSPQTPARARRDRAIPEPRNPRIHYGRHDTDSRTDSEPSRGENDQLVAGHDKANSKRC